MKLGFGFWLGFLRSFVNFKNLIIVFWNIFMVPEKVEEVLFLVRDV